MAVDTLKDQLKLRKLNGAKGFTVTQANRTAYVLQLHVLLLAADPQSNDLPEGDSGIDGREVVRKSTGKGKGKRKKGVTYYEGYCWTEEEEDAFEVEAIVGKVIADGVSKYANQVSAKPPPHEPALSPALISHSAPNSVAGCGKGRHRAIPHRVEELPRRHDLVRAAGQHRHVLGRTLRVADRRRRRGGGRR